MAGRGRDFADIAYTIRIVEKSPGVEEVPPACGILHSIRGGSTALFVGRRAPGADAGRTGRPLVAYLLEGTTFVAADRPDPVELNALGRLPPSD
jgi:hypothetical protein